MPVGKKIYHKMMKRHGERRKREVAWERKVSARVESNTHVVDGTNNKPVVSKPTNAPKGQKKRMVSPMEGAPAINGKAGVDVVEKAVHPTKSKTPVISGGDAAINPAHMKGAKKVKPKKKVGKKQRRCSVCKQTGHTKKTCKMRNG